MKYYTIAKKINRVYGHGDSGDEYHICPIDSYHTDSKDFHPLFETVNEAEKYMDSIEFNDGLIIVSLRLSSQGKSQLMTDTGPVTVPDSISNYILNLLDEKIKLQLELNILKAKYSHLE